MNKWETEKRIRKNVNRKEDYLRRKYFKGRSDSWRQRRKTRREGDKRVLHHKTVVQKEGKQTDVDKEIENERRRKYTGRRRGEKDDTCKKRLHKMKRDKTSKIH